MKLCAKVIGTSGPETILFIPGLTGSSESWDENFQHLSQQYKLVMIDTLGFGHSPKPDIGYTLDDHLQSIRETLTQLEINRMHLVGHSMGTLLALAYACHFPESIEKIVLLALPLFESEQEAREHISHSSLFHRFLAMDTPLAHIVCSIMCAVRPLLLPIMPMLVSNVPPMAAEDSLRHTWLSYSRSLRNLIFGAETIKWLREIKQSVLLIHGRQDTTAPLENVKNRLGLLNHAELIELDAGHDLVFTHSRELAEAVRNFLSGAK